MADLTDVLSGNAPTLAALAVALEGGRTLVQLVGDERFSHPRGGAIVGSSYTLALGLTAGMLTGSAFPPIAAIATCLIVIGAHEWQEQRVGMHDI